MYHFRLKDQEGIFRTKLNIHIVPVRHGRSRVLYSFAVFEWLPRWMVHAISNRFLNSDVWLHNAEIVTRSRSEKYAPYVYASESDKGVIAYRNWWTRYGHSEAPPNTFAAAPYKDLVPLSHRQQIDPWEFHTRQCAACRRALRVMRKIQFGGLVSALLSVLIFRKKNVLAVLGLAGGLFVRHLAGKMATALEGNPHPNDIPDRSVAHKEDYSQKVASPM